MKLSYLQEFISLNAVRNINDIKNIEKEEIVDVTGDVVLIGYPYEKLQTTFGSVSGHFLLGSEKLNTLFGCPKKVGEEFDCSHLSQLKSLEYAPSYIGDTFIFSNCDIKSLVGIHKIVKHVSEMIIMTNNPISEGGLGLLWIEGLQGISAHGCGDFYKASDIINKYIFVAKGKDAWKYIEDCRDELENAGLHEFAKE